MESEFGFHSDLVSERTTPTREEYLADPWTALSEAQSPRSGATWITDVLEAADIWVAEEYGTWTVDGIEAPAADDHDHHRRDHHDRWVIPCADSPPSSWPSPSAVAACSGGGRGDRRGG